MNNNVQMIIVTPANSPQEIVITGVSGQPVTTVILLAGMTGSFRVQLHAPEKNASLAVLIMPLLWGNQVLDLEVVQHHTASDSASSVYVCGALAGGARITCRCRTIVDSGLRSVQTIQQSSLLLLSHAAKAQVVPAIASYSKEIVCHHGAAVGSFDHEQLRLLALKGIGNDRAKELLLHGFMLQHLAQVGIDRMPQHVEDAVQYLFFCSEGL